MKNTCATNDFAKFVGPNGSDFQPGILSRSHREIFPPGVGKPAQPNDRRVQYKPCDAGAISQFRGNRVKLPTF